MTLQENLSRNIRTLRETHGETQEQVAQGLNVTFQAVSKWENGVTVPDALTLPFIAQYFGVTIDELFRPKAQAYRNNACRLLAVYEKSHDPADFRRADAEFARLFAAGQETPDDIRSYGVLHEYRMYSCQEKALALFDRVIAGNARDAIYYSTRQQKMGLLAKIGRGQESIDEAECGLAAEPDVMENHLMLTAACYFAGQDEKCREACQKALERFPDSPMLHLYLGDCLRRLNRFDEAFRHWEQAAALNPEMCDPLFSTAFCLQALHRYGEAAAAWQRVIDWLCARGYVHELEMPQKEMRKAQEAAGRMNTKEQNS